MNTMIDKNEFYRQATRRICGSLEFEKALLESTKFLRREMPVDRMFLQFFDAGLKAMRTVAIATPLTVISIVLLATKSPSNTIEPTSSF